MVNWFLRPLREMMRFSGKEKTPPEEVGRSLNASEGLACICASRGIGANKSIHQCAHWFMKPPPAASDMIRVPAGQRRCLKIAKIAIGRQRLFQLA